MERFFIRNRSDQFTLFKRFSLYNKLLLSLLSFLLFILPLIFSIWSCTTYIRHVRIKHLTKIFFIEDCIWLKCFVFELFLLNVAFSKDLEHPPGQQHSKVVWLIYTIIYYIFSQQNIHINQGNSKYARLKTR